MCEKQRMINGLWRKKEVVFVPLLMQHEVLLTSHSFAFNGHPGVAKTMEKIRRTYWWPEWRSDVKHKVKSILKHFMNAAK